MSVFRAPRKHAHTVFTRLIFDLFVFYMSAAHTRSAIPAAKTINTHAYIVYYTTPCRVCVVERENSVTVRTQQSDRTVTCNRSCESTRLTARVRPQWRYPALLHPPHVLPLPYIKVFDDDDPTLFPPQLYALRPPLRIEQLAKTAETHSAKWSVYISYSILFETYLYRNRTHIAYIQHIYAW